MKRLIYYIVLSFPALVLGQSTDQNYVKTTTYKVPTATPLSASPDAEDGLVNVTYFDGLGRPIQQIAHKQSASGQDIITHIEYDEFGRQVKDYLPYVAGRSGGNMAFDPIARDNTISFYENDWAAPTSVPFSEKQFEDSPLGRVLKQGAPGEAWQLSQGHTINFEYSTNSANEVKLFKAGTSAAPNSAGVYTISLINPSGTVYYPANQLYKTIVTDENGAKTEEFKDKEGRVVLKRAYDNFLEYDTYYVYDIYGNLTYVIPPKAVDLGTITSAVLNDLCYQYQYDSRNRLADKKLPGKAWEYIVYDKLDRVVATGPALSPFSDNPTQRGWLVTKYDALGRLAYTGWNLESGSFSSALRGNLQSLVNNMSNLYVIRQSGAVDGVSIGYANNSTVPAITRLLTVNYYDDYNYPNAPSTLPPFTITELGVQGDVTDKTRGLSTGSWVRVLTTSSEKLFEFTHTFYDKKARPIRTYYRNHLGGYTQTDTYLDFVGIPQYTITTHKRVNTDTELTIREEFEYTPEGKLLEHRHKINNFSTETLSYNDYDELGQLKTKHVGRTASVPLQTVDYKYNIRGWLTDINDVDNLGSDLFAFKINYENSYHYFHSGPGKPIIRYFPKFNGNITETFWRTSSDNVLRKYGYAYDGLNRLLHAYYIKPNSSEHKSPFVNSYNESISYDKNGNIISLERFGDLDSEIDQIVIDDLYYTYNNGNRLLKVEDISNHPEGFKDGTNSGDDYAYDVFGNMTQDLNKGIPANGISYNHLNLPKEILFSGTPTKKINYLYNALGQKVRKVITNGTEITTTDYQGSFHYENQRLRFISTAEGYVNVTTGERQGPNGPSYVFSYVYNYTDHLGNIRLSYTANNRSMYLPPVILEENHYYPFGLKHKKYGSVDKDLVCVDEDCYEVGIDVVPPQSRKTYQYKYQGQERQDELGLNWDSFKWRNYDYAIGRFFNIDPLTEKYNTWSPYAFSGNRVIDARELEGLEPWIVTGRAFIPNKTLSNPTPFSNTKSFAGDNRNSYKVSTTAYRTEQKVRVDFDNKKATTISNRANGTIGYDKDGKVTATSPEGKAGPTPTYTPSTMENKSTTIGMEVDASNKLVTGAPAINYDVNVTITETGEGTFDYSISGQSDGFPAYEFFITNEATGDSYLIYGSNPAATGDTPTALFPPMEKKIDASGNSKDLTPVDKEVKF